MSGTITVKGTGRVTAPPDTVILSMELNTADKAYKKAMDTAAEKIELLNAALEKAGFEKNAVKTTDFSVDLDYEYRAGKNRPGESVFVGYTVRHRLKTEFGFSPERLASALTAVGSCSACPEISVNFTADDRERLKEKMLRAASEDARKKAEILCEASGKTLGELKSIDYNWGEVNFFSPARACFADELRSQTGPMSEIDISPEDIEATDTVTFVWEIR